jgi:hypothetical protein
MPLKSMTLTENNPLAPLVFIAPSYRVVISEIDRYADLLAGSTIFVKLTNTTPSSESQSFRQFIIRYQDDIKFCQDGYIADGTIVTIQSRLRGSGWFNDSISNGVPIIITNVETKLLFEETFPEYPFVSLECINNPKQLRQSLKKVRCFDSEAYIVSHNARLRARFHDMCTTIAIETEC